MTDDKPAAPERRLTKGGEDRRRVLRSIVVGGAVVGASLVGREVVKILKPFRCQIQLYDPYISAHDARELGVTCLPLDTLLATSDVVTLHAPANPDCHWLLNQNNLPLLPDGALLVNTARGMLIEEAALIRELRTGRIFACLDVTDPEPPAPDHPFRTLENVVLTPHYASWCDQTFAVLRRRVGEAALTIARGGVPEFVANPEVLPHRRK